MGEWAESPCYETAWVSGREVLDILKHRH